MFKDSNNTSKQGFNTASSAGMNAANQLADRPETSAFAWRVSEGNVEVIAAGEWITLGTPAEMLERLEIWDFLEWETENGTKRKAYPRGNADSVFYWKETTSAFCEDNEKSKGGTEWSGTMMVKLPDSKAARRAREMARQADLLSHLSEAVSMKIDPQCGWRGLAANPVIHFQFGLGVAVATNGSQVILLDRARLGERPFVAHRTNVLGNVSGTPTPVAEWNFETNMSFSARSKGKTQVELATELLAKLMQKPASSAG